MLWIPNKVLLLLLLSAFLLLAFACFLTAITYCGMLPQKVSANVELYKCVISLLM